MPPPDPVTRLRQIALDLDRFADQIQADTDLDPKVFRFWRTELLVIAAEIERARPCARSE